MATQPDYYSILQVHPKAEKEVIDAAYRRLAAKYHPDVNEASDAAEKMKQINAAYEVLSDPVRRAAYDAAGPRYISRAWRSLLIPAGAIALIVIVAAFRFGFRLGLLLLAFCVGVWLLFALTRSRR